MPTSRPYLRRGAAPLIALACAGCVVAIGDFEEGAHWRAGTHHSHASHYSVRGVDLEYRREIALDALVWEAAGLRLQADAGDIECRAVAAGGNRVLANIREASPGDAELVYRAGKLELSTKSGKPAAFESVRIEAQDSIRSLWLETGSGEIEVEGQDLCSTLQLKSGSGDLNLNGLRHVQQVDLCTGMGDLQVQQVQCERVRLDTGMGSVSVSGCELAQLLVATGMGDICLSHSQVGTRDLHTGMGEVKVED